MAARGRNAHVLLDRYKGWFPLVALLAIALGLRLYGQYWDGGHLFHPDERHILMTTERLDLPWPLPWETLATPESPLNPASFAYGSLPFYLLRATSALMSGIGGAVPFLAAWRDFDHLQNMAGVGRTLSALFDLGTIVTVFLLGARLYRRSVGLLAAAFVTLSVLHIQLSHFYAVDTPMTFFVLATLLGSVHLMHRLGDRASALTGAMIGLALASKVSASPILGAVGVAHLLWLFSDDRGHLSVFAATPTRLVQALRGGIITAGVAGIIFVICQPYAIIDSATYVRNIAEQSSMVRGVADLPYTRQYADRPDFLYFVENLTLFGLGLPLGIAAFVGWLWVFLRAIRSGNGARRRADLVLLAWVVPYFLITGSFHTKFLRYLLPITPILCLFAASTLLDLHAWLGRWRDGMSAQPTEEDLPAQPLPTWVTRYPTLVSGLHTGRLQHLVVALIALILTTTLFYALAFANVYSAPHTAVAASKWVYTNIPRGSAIATEHWEEGMPVGLTENNRAYSDDSMQYQKLTLNLYEDDDSKKLDHIVEQLRKTDYIIFFSNRLYGTIPRLPDRYPMTTEYYKLLFGEQLGFELVAAFSSYPNLLDVAFVDDTFTDPGLPTPPLLRRTATSQLAINLGHADESFSVYDHPKVLIFKKTQPRTVAELRALLEPQLANVRSPGGRPSAAQAFKSLMLDPAQQAMVRAGGTYRDLFDGESLVNRFPILVWIVLVEVLGLAAAPFAFVVFRNLADRGYLLAKTLGLLLLTWLSWITVSLGLVDATRLTAIAAFAVVVAVGLAMAIRMRSEIREFLGRRLRILALAEGVFWLAFLCFLFIRASNPDLWHPARGGEKPMDIAYLMAAIKSATYPPYDPWFAGGYLNYYYYGQLIVGTLIKVSGIVPTTAYNLAVPLLFALTFSGAFAVGYNLVSTSTTISRTRALAGLAAGLFVCVMGNLGGAIQIARELARVGDLDYRSALPGVGSLIQGLAGFVRVVQEPKLLNIPTDWYWPSTRVIEGTINEFPYFTFLYADMHAHMIALPITVFVLTLAIEVVRAGTDAQSRLPSTAFTWATSRLHFSAPTLLGQRTATSTDAPASGRVASRELVETLLGLFVTGLAVGALMPTNSWDFPTYLGLIALSLLIPWYLDQRLSLYRLVLTGIQISIVAAVSFALYLPFHLNFQSFYSGFGPSPGQSRVDDYLVIHGFFLVALLSFVLIDVGDRHRRNSFVRTLRLVAHRWELLPRFLGLRSRLIRQQSDTTEVIVYGAIILLTLIAMLAVFGMALAGLLLVLLVVVAILALRRDNRPEETLFYVLFGIGLALGIATEFIAIDGDIGRMNTVFKFYLQVWTMWGVCSAIALVLTLGRLRRSAHVTLRRTWIGVLSALTLAGFVYPIVATPARVADRFTTNLPLTVDGTAYMPYTSYVDQNRPIRFASDLAAIRWLQDNVIGTPVILEGNTGLYRWGSRVSIYTGLPTVVGWDWHQKQQRWGYQELVDQRLRDVKNAFTTTSIEQTMGLIRKYNVEYVFVGDIERAYYPANGLGKFDAMVGQYLDLVYDAQDVKIYRVR